MNAAYHIIQSKYSIPVDLSHPFPSVIHFELFPNENHLKTKSKFQVLSSRPKIRIRQNSQYDNGKTKRTK